MKSVSEKPLVSIITICYNCAYILEKTIKSVVAQTYGNIEYIIVDGGSTDGTVEIIKKYSNNITKWISEPDDGISDAFNKGIALASGDWIQLLNAGDCFVDNRVLAQFAKIPCQEADCLIITGFSKFGNSFIPKRKIDNNTSLRKKSLISHQASFVHKDVYKEIGKYDTNLGLRMDYDFWLRALKKRRLYFWDKIIIDYAEGGISGQNLRLFYKEERVINKKWLSLYPVWNLVIYGKLFCKLLIGSRK